MFAPFVATPEMSYPIRSEPGLEPVHRKTVLFVEDDGVLSRLFELILERSNMRVVCARDGEQCMRLFGKNRTDDVIVLMACALPDAHRGALPPTA